MVIRSYSYATGVLSIDVSWQVVTEWHLRVPFTQTRYRIVPITVGMSSETVGWIGTAH
jgi:hypothetical protein